MTTLIASVHEKKQSSTIQRWSKYSSMKIMWASL
jgi:hypothetical protein